MACLYCGKRVSMVRQMADPDFCSDEHRRRYGDMARAALSRLMELDAAEVPESSGRRPGVPGPALVERPASSQERRPAARRKNAPAERKAPRPAVAAVTPAERGILGLAPSARDIPASLLCFAEYEFAPPVICFGESGAPAASFRPPALCEESLAPPQRLRAHSPFRSCGAIGMPERELTYPVRGGGPDQIFAGPASAYGFRQVEGRARRRFARPRTTAAPKFAVAAIRCPVREWRIVEPQGIAMPPPAPQPARSFAPGAAKPVPAEAAVPVPAVRIPQANRPATGPSRSDAFAAIEARCDFGFRTVAPGGRKGIGSSSQAAGGLQAREAVLPGRPLPDRAPACVGLQALLPFRPIPPAAGPRVVAACVDRAQPSPHLRIPALPSVHLSCKLLWIPLFPVPASPVRNRVVRPDPGFAGGFTAVSAGGAWQPPQRLVRPAEPSGCTKRFGVLPFVPRPVKRPAAARECSPLEAAEPAVHIPARGTPARREPVLACTTSGMPWAPKPYAVTSEFRLQPDQLTRDPVMPAALPSSRCRRAVREIRAGYFNPEPPGPRGGERKPRPAALDFGEEPETPARRGPERLGIGANIASAAAAPSAAPHACGLSPGPRSASNEFAPHAPRYSLHSAAPFRHEIPGAGTAPPRIAPASRAVLPVPGSLADASRPVLLPRTGPSGPGTPAGVRATSLGQTSWKPVQAAASFRNQPAFAPELPPADPGMPARAPMGLIRRVLKTSGFGPAGAAAILKIASEAHFEHDTEFRTAIALPKREARIQAAFRIGAGLEIRLPVRAPVIAGLPLLAAVAVSIPRVLLPAAPGGGLRRNPSVAPAPVSLVSPRPGDHAATRMPLAAAAVLQSGEGLLRTIHIAAPAPLDGPAAPRMAGLKAVTGVRPAPRGNEAMPAVTAGAPAGTVVLPAWRIGLPQPGCPAAGFAVFEVAECGEVRIVAARLAEALLTPPVLPRDPGPDCALACTLHLPGALNADLRSHAGTSLPAEAGPVIRTEIAPVMIPFEAAPDVDEGEEALAPAVPDQFQPRRARKIGSRLFR